MFKYNLGMKVINKRELVLVCNEVIQGGGGGMRGVGREGRKGGWDR